MAARYVRYLYHELRRRRVFRTAAYYTVGAWGLLQVCDVVFPIIDLPDSALRLVLAGLVAGFPFALVIGWKYDITSTGIRRTPSASEDQQSADLSLKVTDYVLIVALASIATLAVLQIDLGPEERDPATRTSKGSVVVLPFATCPGGEDDAYFASGLAMELIDRLAEDTPLKVLARTSSFSLAGTGLRPSEIGVRMGAEHVVSGILCRTGDILQVSAELLDENDEISWSDTFERRTDVAFDTARSLAAQITAALAVELGGRSPEPRGTRVNSVAWEQLLLGREFAYRGDDERAATAFRRSLRNQPEYDEAIFELALLEMRSWSDPRFAEGIANARPGVEHAMALAIDRISRDDRSAHLHFITGKILATLAYIDAELLWRELLTAPEEAISAGRSEIDSRLIQAEGHLREAIRLNPTRIEPYMVLSFVLERSDRSKDALEVFEAALAQDPYSDRVAGYLAKRMADHGDYRKAIELLERFEQLPETPAAAWFWQLEIMTLHGRWDEKAETLVQILTTDPAAFDLWENRWHAWWFVGHMQELGLSEEARAWKERIRNVPMADWMYFGGGVLNGEDEIENASEPVPEPPEDDVEIDYQEVLNRFQSVGLERIIDMIDSGYYEPAIQLLNVLRHSKAWYPERQARSSLLLVALYQFAGEAEKAEPVLEEVTAYLEDKFDSGIREPEILMSLAEAYARQGRDSESIDMIARAADYDARFSCEPGSLFPTDWAIASLRESSPAGRLASEERVKLLCESVNAKYREMADNIRRILAGYDVDELLAPLMRLADQAGPRQRERE